MCEEKEKISYRGRIAPTPSGYLHRGHVETFKVTYQRAQERNGKIVFRNDDIDKNVVKSFCKRNCRSKGIGNRMG